MATSVQPQLSLLVTIFCIAENQQHSAEATTTGFAKTKVLDKSLSHNFGLRPVLAELDCRLLGIPNAKLLSFGFKP